MLLFICIPRIWDWTVSSQLGGKYDECTSAMKASYDNAKSRAHSQVIQLQMCMHLKPPRIFLTLSLSSMSLAIKYSLWASVRSTSALGITSPAIKMGQCFITRCLTVANVGAIKDWVYAHFCGIYAVVTGENDESESESESKFTTFHWWICRAGGDSRVGKLL